MLNVRCDYDVSFFEPQHPSKKIDSRAGVLSKKKCLIISGLHKTANCRDCFVHMFVCLRGVWSRPAMKCPVCPQKIIDGFQRLRKRRCCGGIIELDNFFHGFLTICNLCYIMLKEWPRIPRGGECYRKT